MLRTGEDADILRGALSRHGSYVVGDRDRDGDGVSGGGAGALSPSDVEDVAEAVRIAAEGDWRKISGAAEFLCLLLSVEEDQFGGPLTLSPPSRQPPPLSVPSSFSISTA